MHKKLIIDGSNLLFRTYCASKQVEEKNLGEHSKPQTYVYYFLKALASYVNLFGSSNIIMVWDYHDDEYNNKRKEDCEEYKSNKIKNPDVFKYSEEIKEILDSLGVKQIYPKRFEGDDIMFWLCAKKYPNECILITADTDLYQLIIPSLNENIIFNPIKKQQINNVFLRQHYGVKNGIEFIFKKALKGDKSDNLEGVFAIRKEKVDAVLYAIFKNDKIELENAKTVLKHEDYIKFRKNVSLMLFGAVLSNEEEIAWYEELLEKKPKISKERFIQICSKLKFWNIVNKADSWFSNFTEKHDYERSIDILSN